jgi:hypothetical protein
VTKNIELERQGVTGDGARPNGSAIDDLELDWFGFGSGRDSKFVNEGLIDEAVGSP